MFWIFSLLLAETVFEGLLCNAIIRSERLNMQICYVAAAALIILLLNLTLSDWQIWLWALLLAGYRVINLLRVAARRLPQPELNSISLRAFKWLIFGQILLTAIAWAIVESGSGMLFLTILALLQLLCAIILLRASTHTWQHAHAPKTAQPLTDKELPTLSVLIPARNETDGLERCLVALVASNYPKLEILVLDDSSVTRRTPEIIRSFAHEGVRFVQGKLPEESRWLAKNYAYAQLAHEASGELLLFCGVDALFEPQSLRLIVAELLGRQRDMLSVMPLRARDMGRSGALLQAVRYYWEICLPRRFFKRPPVLSTCWLIRAAALKRMGGFEAISHSVNPEAPLARHAVVTDSYSFIRSDDTLGVYSNKPANEQYGTSVRVRYPQLHRRLELVALASIFEFTFLLGPLLGFGLAWLLPKTMAYMALWGVTLLFLVATYALVTVGARLTNAWTGWLLMPVAFVVDLFVLHISLWKYEFGVVEWKGRNVNIPVMHLKSERIKQL